MRALQVYRVEWSLPWTLPDIIYMQLVRSWNQALAALLRAARLCRYTGLKDKNGVDIYEGMLTREVILIITQSAYLELPW